MSKFSDLVRKAEKNSLLIGDFNLPDIDWENGTAKGRSKEFLEAVEDSLMSQMVDFSTHIKGNLLDLVVTNIPERVLDIYDAGRLGRSDHVMIVTKISMKQAAMVEIEGRPDWQRADWAGMRDMLADVNWRRDMNGKSVEEAWTLLTSKINQTVKDFVPLRRRRNQNRPAWLSQNILREVRKKKRLWAKAKTGEMKDEYKAAEKKVRNLIRNAKRSFEKKLARDGGVNGNKRQFFAYVKTKTKSRPSIRPLKKKDGTLAKEDQDMVQVLNTFFSEVFTREDLATVPEPEQLNYGEGLDMVNVTKRKVEQKIKKLRTEAAAGPDMIGPRILKELSGVISSPLATIMRRSMEEGKIPEDWKEANLTPIYKKGPKNSPGNYRPVSLSSVSCKILESIIKDDVMHYLEKKKLIRPSQHGFMKGKSCVSNILEFLEKVTAAVDSGESVDIIFLDFAKAFDKVPRERLLNKIRAHGLQGNLLRWIREWLTNRKQRVVLNGKLSD